MIDVGQVVGKNYELVARLGEGGMGCVFQARDRNLGREVAIKFLVPHLVNDPETVNRFLNEGRALATIDHPAVARVFHSGVDEPTGIPFLVMEFFDGRPLNEFRERFRNDPGAVADAFRQLLTGIAACHQKNIVHRDLKPQNILLNAKGRVKLVDFGIAKTATCQTKTGAIMGTPQYMAPEQCHGQQTTAKSDIYSLGIILFEMICDRLPFEVQPDTSNPALAMAVLHVNAQPDLTALDATPARKRWQPLIRRMLEKKPERRPDAAEVMAIVDDLFPPLAPAGSKGQTGADARPDSGGNPVVIPAASPAGEARQVLGEALTQSARHLSRVTATLARTFGKKSPLDLNRQLTPASLTRRLQSFLIDALILLVSYALLSGTWWITQRAVYGPTAIPLADAPANRAFHQPFEFDFQRNLYVRQRGFTESFLDLNIRYPLILIVLYFSVFWAFKQATPGQIAVGLAVVCRDGQLTFGLAVKRSVLFVAACLTLVGFLGLLVGEKRVFYDRVCRTDVVE